MFKGFKSMYVIGNLNWIILNASFFTWTFELINAYLNMQEWHGYNQIGIF